jgi:hypothetical protein
MTIVLPGALVKANGIQGTAMSKAMASLHEEAIYAVTRAVGPAPIDPAHVPAAVILAVTLNGIHGIARLNARFNLHELFMYAVTAAVGADIVGAMVIEAVTLNGIHGIAKS